MHHLRHDSVIKLHTETAFFCVFQHVGIALFLHPRKIFLAEEPDGAPLIPCHDTFAVDELGQYLKNPGGVQVFKDCPDQDIHGYHGHEIRLHEPGHANGCHGFPAVCEELAGI